MTTVTMTHVLVFPDDKPRGDRTENIIRAFADRCRANGVAIVAAYEWDDHVEVRRCGCCAKPFVPKRKTSRYCNGVCRNRQNSRNHYWRSRAGETP